MSLAASGGAAAGPFRSPDFYGLASDLVHILHDRGFGNVRAPVAGYEPPLLLHPEDPAPPDVMARSNLGRADAFAVETRASLIRDETAQKWRALATAAETAHVNFWVVVRREDLRIARRRQAQLGLAARVLGI